MEADDFWKDRFHLCAIFAGFTAQEQGRLEDSEYVRQLAYSLFEARAFKQQPKE